MQPRMLRQHTVPPCRCSRFAPFHEKELLPSRKRVHSSRPRLRGLDPHRITCHSSQGLAKTKIAPLFGFTSKSTPSSKPLQFCQSLFICRVRKRPRQTKINFRKSAIFDDDLLGISSLPFHRSNCTLPACPKLLAKPERLPSPARHSSPPKRLRMPSRCSLLLFLGKPGKQTSLRKPVSDSTKSKFPNQLDVIRKLRRANRRK